MNPPDFRFSTAKLIGSVLGYSFVDHIDDCRLLQMPDLESIKVLGDKAIWFCIFPSDLDGDLLLKPVGFFKPSQRAAALEAGGKIVHGYRFRYPCSVADDPHLPRGWCGDKARGLGYALHPEVAFAVSKASFARAEKEEKELRRRRS